MIVLCPYCDNNNDNSAAWRCESFVNGGIPCVDSAGHDWVVNDDDENICYCCKCGCCEY